MSEIDAVYLADEIKLFRLRGELFDMGSPFHDWSETKMQTAYPVPVRNDEYEIIGSAAVYADGTSLVADIVIDYQCPERLDIQTGRKLYAYPCCDIGREKMDVLDADRPSKVHFLNVKDIVITGEKPGTTSEPLTIRE